MNRRTLAIAGVIVLALAATWVLFVGLPRWYARRNAVPAAAAGTAAPGSAPAVRKITATLFYVGEDGMTLKGAQREVVFNAGVPEQARAIIEAQIAQPPAPLVSAIPPNVKLREVFVTERGDAFLDFSGELVSKHTGGALDELLTVYTLVNAITTNLPAVTRVQILVDGKEVDTLAGHVDLRHPLSKSTDWIVHDPH